MIKSNVFRVHWGGGGWAAMTCSERRGITLTEWSAWTTWDAAMRAAHRQAKATARIYRKQEAVETFEHLYDSAQRGEEAA